MAQWTTTYAGLVSLIEDYVEDTSAEFTSAVQGCINRAEERVIRDLDLSIFNTTVSSTTSDGVSTYTKPWTDAPAVSVFFSGSLTFAERRTRAWVQAHGGSGVPQYFHETETTIFWAPVPDGGYAFTITYIDRPDALSASNTTNWLTRNVADLLLYAALVECESFLISPERVQEFEAKYAQILGPTRGFWRDQAQNQYEPIAPVAQPVQTR